MGGGKSRRDYRIYMSTHELMIVVGGWLEYKGVHYTTLSIFEYFGNLS